jgi:hypothetical protein
VRSPAAFVIQAPPRRRTWREHARRRLVLTAEDVRDLDRAAFYRYRARRLARNARAGAGKAKAALRGDGR